MGILYRITAETRRQALHAPFTASENRMTPLIRAIREHLILGHTVNATPQERKRPCTWAVSVDRVKVAATIEVGNEDAASQAGAERERKRNIATLRIE